MAVYVVSVVVLTNLFAQGTYTVYPFVVALGRNNRLHTADKTGVVVSGDKRVLTYRATRRAYALIPYVYANVGNYGCGGITAVFTAAILDEVVVTLGLTDTAVATAVECPEVLTLRGICVEDVELDDLC